MKKNTSIIYLSEFLLLIYIFVFKFFISRYLVSYLEIINIIFLLLHLLVTYIFLGFPRKRLLINKNARQTLIICFIVYYVSTYLFGLFFGFLRSGYILNFFNIFKNVLYGITFYSLKEMYRYVIIKKVSSKKILPVILLVVLLAGLDIVIEMNIYSFTSGVSIFEFIEASVLPRLALSALLSYMAFKFNYKISIFYLLLFDLPKYFLPIFPDMGMYIEAIIKLIFIFVCYYQLSVLLEKYERQIPIVKDGSSFRMRGGLIALLVVLVTFVGSISGVFKYHLFAIGSNSMVPVFSRGDVVLIKKLNMKEIKMLETEDIIAFNYNNQIIVHRIIEINGNGENYIIKTKGDNNDSIDAWTLDTDDIYGKVEGVVKYLGIPSVELSEHMNKEW